MPITQFLQILYLKELAAKFPESAEIQQILSARIVEDAPERNFYDMVIQLERGKLLSSDTKGIINAIEMDIRAEINSAIIAKQDDLNHLDEVIDLDKLLGAMFGQIR